MEAKNNKTRRQKGGVCPRAYFYYTENYCRLY